MKKSSLLASALFLSASVAAFAQTVDKADFKAWHNLMPGSAHKLIVTGRVTVPTTGWTVSLVEAQPASTDPSTLLLEVKAQKPSGMAGQMISHPQVRFEKDGGDGYTKVTIRGAGPQITIETTEAH